MKKYINLKITDLILIAFEMLLCGVLISQIIFNDFPFIAGSLLIFLIFLSLALIIGLSYRDRKKPPHK